MLETRDGIEKFDVKRRVVLGQRDGSIKVNEFRHGAKTVRLGEAITSLTTAADFDEFIGAAFAKGQRVLAGLG